MNGLLHISDMAWRRVGHPEEIVKVGDTVSVKILSIDKAAGRVSLGLKQLQEQE
jgi:small subunit ribosomal protein S1